MRCRDNGLGNDPCVLKTECQFCNAINSNQKSELATPTYKATKDKKTASPLPSLVDPGSVKILRQVANNSKSTGDH